MSHCLLAVFAMFLAIISPTIVPAVVLTLETSEVDRHFCFHNQNNSTSSPGVLSNGALTSEPVAGGIFDVISSLNTKFFEIWSSVTGYGELCLRF